MLILHKNTTKVVGAKSWGLGVHNLCLWLVAQVAKLEIATVWLQMHLMCTCAIFIQGSHPHKPGWVEIEKMLGDARYHESIKARKHLWNQAKSKTYAM